MSDNQRHRQEYHKPRYFPVTSAVVIEAGDLLYWDSTNSTVKPASSISYSSLAQAQEDFAADFVGMAGDRSRDGDTDDIQVDTAGIAEFECASTTFEIGDMVGVDDNSGGAALEDQKVIAVSSSDLAIGRVTKRYSSSTTSVRVELFPKYTNLVSGGGGGSNPVYVEEYTVTSADDTAGYIDVNTGWGVTIDGPILVQLKNSSSALYADADLVVTKLTGGDLGKIRVADGTTRALTANDILSIAIWKNSNS